MNLEEYQKQANRTCPNLGTEATNLSHMTLGMFTEYSEYIKAKLQNDIVGIGEECADVNWYIANYCSIRGYSLQELWKDRESFESITDSRKENYLYYLSELQDLSKKYLAYGKEIDREREVIILKSLLYNLEFFWLDYPEIKLGRILQNNIDKLRKRFPNKFDKELAVNRNLKAERIELEK